MDTNKSVDNNRIRQRHNHTWVNWPRELGNLLLYDVCGRRHDLRTLLDGLWLTPRHNTDLTEQLFTFLQRSRQFIWNQWQQQLDSKAHQLDGLCNTLHGQVKEIWTLATRKAHNCGTKATDVLDNFFSGKHNANSLNILVHLQLLGFHKVNQFNSICYRLAVI